MWFKDFNKIFPSLQEGIKNVSSFDELVSFLETNASLMMVNAFYEDMPNIELPDSKFVISQLQISWNEEVSNSHNAPFGKATNWGGIHKDEPRSYPGFIGYISYTCNDNVSTVIRRPNERDMFDNFPIYFGTSTGNNSRKEPGLQFWHRQIYMFASEWLGLAGLIEKLKKDFEGDLIIERLSSTNNYLRSMKDFKYSYELDTERK